MMKILLDTNICIYIAKNHHPAIIGHLAKYRKGEIAISSITWAEFSCGIAKEGKEAVDRLLDFIEVIPFCKKSAEIYALLTIEHPGRKANFDRLIAAHAIALNVTLVSNNTTDFALYQTNGLKLDNWYK